MAATPATWSAVATSSPRTACSSWPRDVTVEAEVEPGRDQPGGQRRPSGLAGQQAGGGAGEVAQRRWPVDGAGQPLLDDDLTAQVADGHGVDPAPEMEPEGHVAARVDLDRHARTAVDTGRDPVGPLAQHAGQEQRGDRAVDRGGAELGTPRQLVARDRTVGASVLEHLARRGPEASSGQGDHLAATHEVLPSLNCRVS